MTAASPTDIRSILWIESSRTSDCATTVAAASLAPLGLLSLALRCSAGRHARVELRGLERVVLCFSAAA